MASLKMIDIGANLLDEMFDGVYHEKRVHERDLDLVLDRSKKRGVERIILTAGSLSEARKAIEFVSNLPDIYTTVGVHPTRCKEFEDSGDGEAYLSSLVELAKVGKSNGKVVAVGEFGLDYDRLEFCPKEIQQKWFEKQFAIVEATDLPLFLHLRNACDDFCEIISRNRSKFRHGVAHSFDGTKEELSKLLALDLHIGINGCSLKATENLEVVKQIPLDRLLIETDAPWCQIRPSHASSKLIKTLIADAQPKKFKLGDVVRGRNEPQHLIQVLEVIASLRGQSIAEVASAIYENTLRVFFSGK